MNEMAQLYIDTAKAYDHSAIFVHPNPGGVEATQWLLELIREKSGDEYYIVSIAHSIISPFVNHASMLTHFRSLYHDAWRSDLLDSLSVYRGNPYCICMVGVWNPV